MAGSDADTEEREEDDDAEGNKGEGDNYLGTRKTLASMNAMWDIVKVMGPFWSMIIDHGTYYAGGKKVGP